MIGLLVLEVDWCELSKTPPCLLDQSISLLEFKCTLSIDLSVFQTNMCVFGEEGNTNKAEFLE